MNVCKKISKFVSASLSGYLSPSTRILSPIVGLEYFKDTTRISHENKIKIEFETAKQPEFEPGSPGPKNAVLTIKLHSIDEYTWIF